MYRGDNYESDDHKSNTISTKDWCDIAIQRTRPNRAVYCFAGLENLSRAAQVPLAVFRVTISHENFVGMVLNFWSLDS
jgi:hypothetical protein